MNKLIKICENDDVGVVLQEIMCGECISGVTAAENIPVGHKIALRDIAQGEPVIKYGCKIGRAKCNISAGEWVHTQNLETCLEDKCAYEYSPARLPGQAGEQKPRFFMGYERADGSVGIRNEIWILPLVGCVNSIVRKIEREAEKVDRNCDGVFAYTHPYGCSQLGDDHEMTRRVLAGLCKNPNAAGVLLVGLGCENNTLESFLPLLNDFDKEKVRTLVIQDCDDEIFEGIRLVSELASCAAENIRTRQPISKLCVAMKCGGSDGLSGITANPLCGRVSDKLSGSGARVLLTETPEMFGAETLLMNRASDKSVFEKTVDMIDGFKEYYISHGQPVYENPSPGNREGGITTLEEKSLGCIQKGGTSKVVSVLECAQACASPGLNLMSGPGNDIVSCTNLAAAGAQIILFTTGRGTPLGAPVPTLKISSNTGLLERKSRWIDFDAGSVLKSGFDEAAESLFELLIKTASGQKTMSELNSCREIAIFKSGVTL